MEEKKEAPERSPEKLEKLKVGLLAGILAVLVLFMLGVGLMLWEVKAYADTAGEVINRLNEVSAALEELDTERMVATANEVTKALDEAKLAEMVDSLNQVSVQLAQVDWEAMGNNINTLAVQAQESLVRADEAVAKAIETIDEMDIETLNSAIRDLQAAVEPLAKFANLFNK